ncbi:GNAT family N-acetyltransferase [Roseibium sediminis]|uniref:GNAT family N-acetyltransferase n=1 Tax=Roseibium sediminis TaxID=1775174 RepID=UPI00123D754A|nr:GNAT family N-acetyltransferase [Roseibium sediminis]
MATTFSIESPLDDDVRGLVAELSCTMRALTPAHACHELSVEEMADERTTLFVARIDGIAAACGALHRHADGVCEVKRMFTRPAFQGHGLARQILDRILETATSERFSRIVLETGWNYDAARRLYERAGFEQCAAILDYPDDPESVFYSRSLAAD